jgi:hypothetical protein
LVVVFIDSPRFCDTASSRGVDGRSARARQQQQDGGDADGDHHDENDEGGFQHGRLLP